jgi:hypothetical protein
MHHPSEHSLALDRDHLVELLSALEAQSTRQQETHDDFIIVPL